MHKSSKRSRAAAINCPNAAEPRPCIRQGGKAATTCACTSCASALLPSWIGSQRLGAVKTVDYARLCLALFRSHCLSLTSILNPKLPALDSLAPSDTEQSVDASDVSVAVWEPPTLDGAPANTTGSMDPPPPPR